MPTRAERAKIQREKERIFKLSKEQQVQPPLAPSTKDVQTGRRRELQIDGSLTVILALFPFGWQMLEFPNAKLVGLLSWSVCLLFTGRLVWVVLRDRLSSPWKWVASAAIPIFVACLAWGPISHRLNKPKDTEGLKTNVEKLDITHNTKQPNVPTAQELAREVLNGINKSDTEKKALINDTYGLMRAIDNYWVKWRMQSQRYESTGNVEGQQALSRLAAQSWLNTFKKPAASILLKCGRSVGLHDANIERYVNHPVLVSDLQSFGDVNRAVYGLYNSLLRLTGNSGVSVDLGAPDAYCSQIIL